MATREEPIVAITMAEASGIGPEILMKAINERSIFDHCRPLLIGDYKIMKMVRDEFGIAGKIRVIKTVDGAVWESDTANMIDLDNIPLGSFRKGHPNATTGKAMIEYCAVRKIGDRSPGTAQSGGESEEGRRPAPLGRARGEGRGLAACPASPRAFPANEAARANV